MLKKRNTPKKTAVSEEIETSVNDELLRIRRERVNEAIEIVGYDPVKIEQYLNRKHVA
ncbi:MAG: hypothetical protein ACO1NS_14415 [Daejeonella sp.]|uniref:hypothetical protein n=1 Tax=Daejeonella sp. JGW-45 TaxID=3034148 RepID=UPI0023EC6DD7|nr:hypothetical protein [Daejeonella sp. JGW-45]